MVRIQPNTCTGLTIGNQEVVILNADGRVDIESGEVYPDGRVDTKNGEIFIEQGAYDAFHTSFDLKIRDSGRDTTDTFDAYESCGYSYCNDTLSVNWDDGRVKESYVEDMSPEPPWEFKGDRIFISIGRHNLINNWETKDLDEIGETTSDDFTVEGIPDRLCPGQSGKATIRIDDTCTAIEANSIIFRNIVTDKETTVDISEFRGSSREETVEYSVPSDIVSMSSDSPLFEVEINGFVKQIYKDVGSSMSELSLQEINDISDVCAGDSISKDITVENAGDCSSSVELLVDNSFDDSTISTDELTVQPATVEPSTGSFSLRFDAPSGALGQEITYTANLLYGGQSVASEQFTVSVGTGDVQLDNVDAPSRACPSDDIRFSVNVLNQGSCDTRASARVVNDVNDEVLTSSIETIRAGSDRGYRFEDTIPSNLSGGITYNVIIESIDGDTLASESFTVAVGSKDISLSNLEFDDSICVGKEVDWSVEASNNGDCDADVTLGIQKQGQESIDILGTDSARSGSSARFRESITVPVSDLGTGQNQYTIYALIDEPEGLTPVDTLTHTVTLQDSDVSLVGTSFPESRCVGDNIVGTFNVANDGNCDGQYRVLITDSITGNEVEVETDDIRGNRRTSVTFDDTMPTQALEDGSISYEYELQTLRPGGFTTISTGSDTVNVEAKNTNITEVDAPTEACVGSDITATVVLRNDSRCDAQYRLIADKPLRPGTEVIDESSIPSNTDKNVQIQDVIPSKAVSQSALSYGVTVEVRQVEEGVYEAVDGTSFNISILQSDVQLDSVNSPAKACVTSQPEIGIQISNTGDCPSEYRIRYERINDGQAEIIETGSIPSEQKISSSFQDEIAPSLSDEDALTYEIVCEKRFNENQSWEVVETSTTAIEVLTPTISLASTEYPEFDTPGDKQYQIQITNESQCSTTLDISISGSTSTEEISAGGSITLNDSFTLKDFDVVRDIVVVDNSVQETAFEQTFTVKPHNFVSVNQSNGEVKIVGGFSEEVGYTGNIIATGVVGEDLEETDRVAGVVGVNKFAGSMSTDSDDEDIIRFGALKGFNIASQESVFIILDGEIKGKSRTYRHTTISTSAIGSDEQAGIETISGPLSNFGTIPEKLGIRPGILSPKINRDR